MGELKDAAELLGDSYDVVIRLTFILTHKRKWIWWMQSHKSVHLIVHLMNRFYAVSGGLKFKIFCWNEFRKGDARKIFLLVKKICHLIFLQALKNKKNPKNVDFPGFLRGADRI